MEKPQPIRLVVADDHPIVREGLRCLLEAKTNYKVIGEASDGAEAVRLARQLKPDILTMALRMRGQNGLEALRQLSSGANAAPVRVILLTAHIEKSQIVEALQLGARGVVLKDSATQIFIKAVHTVMVGEYWVLRKPLSNLESYLRILMLLTHEEARQKRCGLTPRLLFRMLCQQGLAGFSNKEIAELLRDQCRYHETPLNNIFDKLGVSSRLELGLSRETKKRPVEL